MGFLKDIQEGKELKNFWQEYKNFCADITTIDVDYYLEVLPELLKKLEKKYGVRQLEEAIKKVSKNDPTIATELYSKILKTNDEYLFPQLTSILAGLYETETNSAITKTKDLLQNENIILKKIGLSVIAQYDLLNDQCPGEFLEWINSYLLKMATNEEGHLVWQSIFFACRNQRNSINNSEKIIDFLASQRDIEIQLELLNYLNYNLDITKEWEIIEKYLPDLLYIELQYAGAYNQLSYLLEKGLKVNMITSLNFIEKWIELNRENARKISYFTHCLNTLFSEHHNEFQKVFTEWLNKDNPNFHIAIFELCRVGTLRDISHLTLSEEILESYSMYDIEYITYKILAYVYDKDLSFSLIFSILQQKSDDPEIARFLSEMFISHLIFNYYSAIEYLNDKKKEAKPKLKKIIEAIISEGGKSYSAYSDLKILKEFAPSEMRLRYYNTIQSKKFNKSFKETENNSNSFLSFVKNIHFRTGKSIFSKHQGEYTKDMTPGLISHSAEMPRGEFIDPIGQAKMRLLWQNFKRQK